MQHEYLVQTWNTSGQKENHYEVVIEHASQLAELKKFLRAKHGQVLVTRAKKNKK